MKEVIYLAIRSVSCMFMMPICGVTCFSFLLSLYYYWFAERSFLFTNSVATEIFVMALTGFGFYYALAESLKVSKQLKAMRTPRKRRSSGSENDSER